MFDHLVKTLDLAIAARTTGEHRFSPIVEVINDQWYMTESGLESPLGVSITSDESHLNLQEINLAKRHPGVDGSKLEAALNRFWIIVGDHSAERHSNDS